MVRLGLDGAFLGNEIHVDCWMASASVSSGCIVDDTSRPTLPWKFPDEFAGKLLSRHCFLLQGTFQDDDWIATQRTYTECYASSEIMELSRVLSPMVKGIGVVCESNVCHWREDSTNHLDQIRSLAKK